MDRTLVIQNVFDKFHGNAIPMLYFQNEKYPYMEYYYDHNSDCIKMNDYDISVPIHYDVKDVNSNLLLGIIFELEDKVIEYFKNNKNIDLLPYED